MPQIKMFVKCFWHENSTFQDEYRKLTKNASSSRLNEGLAKLGDQEMLDNPVESDSAKLPCRHVRRLKGVVLGAKVGMERTLASQRNQFCGVLPFCGKRGGTRLSHGRAWAW